MPEGEKSQIDEKQGVSRRDFLKASSAAIASEATRSSGNPCQAARMGLVRHRVRTPIEFID